VTNVLVLSGTAAAINYINSLAKDAAIRLHVTDSNRYCPGLYAPGVISHWVPRARDTERYRAALDRIIADEAIEVLIPTSDYDVEGVTQYQHDGWSPKLAMFRPPFEAFNLLSHKQRLMTRLSTTLPDVVPVTVRDELEAAALTMPVVVKPIGESGGKGVSIVSNRNDLPAAVRRIRGLFEDRFVIQQFIPGRTYVATLVYDTAGELVIGVGMRSTRTFFTWGGGGCAGEMVDEPEMVRLSDAVVQACGGWCGPINFEWRRHSETGGWYLMEANCRLNGYSYLTTMNGVCLPRIVLALLTGERLPAVSKPAERTRNFTIGFRETVIDDWTQTAAT
jgi:predicted ATP-grasp superfamily ATP-dependent carboligase